MRLSRPRVLLRAALLLVLAGFMAWRATETGRSAAEPGLDRGAAVTLSRIALVEWILAGLAVLTAGAAALALRQKARKRLLDLGGGPGPGGPATGPEATQEAPPPGDPRR